MQSSHRIPTFTRSLFHPRALHTTSRRLKPFAASPAPPPLPKEEQNRFEALQRASTGAFSTPRPTPSDSTTSTSQTSTAPAASISSRPQINQSPASSSEELKLDATVEATGDGKELHPDVRRGAKPEFEGDINPKTGEMGGPKNEPLRWGGGVDWSYNGRVTDF